MADILSQLWQLQQLDSEIDTLNKKEEEIPKKIEGLLLSQKEAAKKLEEKKKEILNLKKSYKEKEIDLKECEEKLKQYSVQLYSAKSNEQYKAFLNEIENQKKLKGEIEDKLILILEGMEVAEKEEKVLERDLQELEKLTQAKIASLKKEEEEAKKRRAEKEEERASFISQLDATYLAIYERIRTKKGGVAVAEIIEERCSACFNPIPPQIILEIGRREKLYYCDYCGRILYLKGRDSV
ncbi:MAG: C4-type zinc ribbon domain-containing protein [candidate division WOR-3 bacterium]